MQTLLQYGFSIMLDKMISSYIIVMIIDYLVIITSRKEEILRNTNKYYEIF